MSPNRHPISNSPILRNPDNVRPLRSIQIQPLQPVLAPLDLLGLFYVSVLVDGDFLAGARQQGEVHVGVDAPGGTLEGKGFAVGELEDDEAAFGAEELGLAGSPFGSERHGEGTGELEWGVVG